MYKNAKVTPAHVRHVVRKCWRMFEKVQKNYSDAAWENYRDQFILAERAIAALPEEQRKEFELP